MTFNCWPTAIFHMMPSHRYLAGLAVLIFAIGAAVGNASAQLNVLYTFQFDSASSSFPNGQQPSSELIQVADGNYYTTVSLGGSGTCLGGVGGVTSGCGGIVKVTPSGTFSVVYRFPFLSRAAMALYVTVVYGGGQNAQGVQDQGAIDRFTTGFAPLPPVITSFSPTKGIVGANVTISGSAFVGARAVHFNGVSATFTVKASGFMVTKVPVGASSGPITGTTPSGTATSKKSFTVL